MYMYGCVLRLCAFVRMQLHIEWEQKQPNLLQHPNYCSISPCYSCDLLVSSLQTDAQFIDALKLQPLQKI